MTENEASSNGDGEDRISWLPDEILHEILDRLDYHYQCAETALVSKRWNHLWLSYPVLEFDCTNCSPSRSTMDSFIAAATRKFSSSGLNSYIKSLRIVCSDSAFIRAILDLIQNREPEDIDMNLSRDSVIPAPLINSSRLRTLKLYGSMLLEDQYKMINLQVIHLSHVSIENGALNSMIAAAPLLEKLTLIYLYTSKRVDFCKCNHANLKHLQISKIILVDVPDSIQIEVGALPSLESLSLTSLNCKYLEIMCSSLLPSLKSLEIGYCYNFRDHVVNKLISISPSLLSLRLVRLDKVNELKIESPTLEKLELMWYDWDPERVFRIDAPRLVNVRFGGNITFLHAISDATNSFQAAQIRSCTFELSLYCSLIANQIITKLKQFLKKVTRQFQFVELKLHNITSLSRSKEWDQAEGSSPTPVVERVEVKLERESVNHNFLYNMLWSCHPKYFSLHCDAYTNRLSSLKLINEVFMERTFHNCKKITCKCWRHQLKDVKFVNARDKDKEELVNISADMLSALQCKDQVLFKLIWIEL